MTSERGKPPAPPAPPASSASPASLAEDLRRLEEIVRQLERDDGDLDQALALFEEGVARLRAARERLGEAETRVKKVLEDAQGTLRTEDLDGGA